MAPGAAIAHYRVLSRLGAGGMGEVYLAEDTRLERLVALKILPERIAADSERMRRFIQEAKAVAVLSHPNIAHIYDIDEADGVHYMAMEYVEGQTLAAKLNGRPLPTSDIIEIGTQIAEALAEAHSKGITHRDIKPANVMITPRGQAKVLDFGLAKVRKPDHTLQTETVSGRLTDAGIVMGTVQYMSPEQALGQDVDHRTDIFSLGSVLYEMATGRRAFPGPTTAAVFSALLNKHPDPPSKVNGAIPPELDRIVLKALEKDAELRYQTASDLTADLKRTKRDADSGRTTAPAEVGSRSLRGRSRLPLLIVSVAAMIALASWYFNSRSSARTEPVALKATPLTAYPGNESQPSFSPDGSQVAFTWNSETEENWDIYVKVVEAGAPLRLTSSPATDFSPAWSPDGRQIIFLRQESDSAAFYLIPPLGGLERKLADASPQRTGVDAPYASWSPDSNTVALVDKTAQQEPMSIFLHNIETGERRKLTNPPDKTYGDSSPQFSADGRMLAFVRTGALAVQDIYVVPVAGGEPERLTFDNRRIYGLAWNPSDGLIYFSSARAGSSRLWKISPKGGAPERIIGIGENASFIAISPQGRRLAYTRSILDTNVWRFDLTGSAGAAGKGTRLISSTRYEQGPHYSPDGRRIVFASNRSGTPEIWLCDKEGNFPTRLTYFEGASTGSPHWSPDGKTIAFDSRPNANPDVYIVSAEGGTPRRMTTEPSDDVVPTYSNDGRWIYFASNRTGTYQLWKIPAEGGTGIQVTKNGGFYGIESPDGKYIYYAKSPRAPGLWRVPIAGGEEEPVLESLRAGFWGYWAIVPRGVYFLERREIQNIGIRYYLRLLDLKTMRESTVMPIEKRPFNAGLSVSPDGRHFLYTQVDQSDTDIMLVEDFR
ncbi:MAG: serine/threonine-protein kinase [Bryobacteraceae bacterium]|nr:serine/threonine-protein kinase [Bryobacteraceae bacterium]